jgi:hypothetical protein
MRTLLIASLFALSTATLAQQAPQQQKQQQPQQPQSAEEQEKQKELQERARAEGAAGGTAPLPDEKRKAVGAGAGPHRRDNLPSPEKLPRDEPVKPGS